MRKIEEEFFIGLDGAGEHTQTHPAEGNDESKDWSKTGREGTVTAGIRHTETLVSCYVMSCSSRMHNERCSHVAI
jgi:hypothetical protein